MENKQDTNQNTQAENFEVQNASALLYMRKNTFSANKRLCPLEALPAEKINYKNIRLLRQFTSERGKIMPSRITGVSAKKQRLLRRAIKQARSIALLPIENS